MGSDDLFKKKKARKLRDISRKKRTRDLYKRVLIVCEGQKTEPLYFDSLKKEYRLQATDIRITNAKGSDPMNLVKHAIEEYKASQKEGNDFDFVYCVFDKDDHANYKQAINEISKINNMEVFLAITSVPCFEFWLLLHFCCTAKPFRSVKGKSAGEQVVCKLQKYISRYKKGDKNTFELTKSNLNQAI